MLIRSNQCESVLKRYHASAREEIFERGAQVQFGHVVVAYHIPLEHGKGKRGYAFFSIQLQENQQTKGRLCGAHGSGERGMNDEEEPDGPAWKPVRP